MWKGIRGSRRSYRMRKLMALVLSGTLLVACLGGCGREEVITQDKPENDTIKIGFTIDSLVVERWCRDRDVFVTRAEELGAEVNIQNAGGDVETQIKQMEYFIEKGMDVIVIAAADSDAFADVVANAHKKGIKVIAYDRQLNNTNADLYVTFNNQMVGQLMAEALYEQLGHVADIIMVNGPTTDNNVALVDEGFNSVKDSHRWNLKGDTYIEGWKQELAYDYMRSIMDTALGCGGIMCGNDAIAGQVIKALSENRAAGRIVVVGQDADLDACQRIVEGTQYMTVYKPIDQLASTAAEYAVSLARGGDLSDLATASDGTYQVPYSYITPYAVTADNIDEVIIAGGFHMKDEVYLNVTE